MTSWWPGFAAGAHAQVPCTWSSPRLSSRRGYSGGRGEGDGNVTKENPAGACRPDSGRRARARGPRHGNRGARGDGASGKREGADSRNAAQLGHLARNGGNARGAVWDGERPYLPGRARLGRSHGLCDSGIHAWQRPLPALSQAGAGAGSLRPDEGTDRGNRVVDEVRRTQSHGSRQRSGRLRLRERVGGGRS